MTAQDIYTIAGNDSFGYSGNGAAATSAELNYPQGVGIDANGDVVLSDYWNFEVRVVAATSGTLGGGSVSADDIYALAGTGGWSDAGYSGPPTDAELDSPSSVRTDAAGDVVLDRHRHRHRPLRPGRHRHLLRPIHDGA